MEILVRQVVVLCNDGIFYNREDMISKIQLCLKHSSRISGRKNIQFQPGLNVVIGSNGSGKSSLLSGCL